MPLVLYDDWLYAYIIVDAYIVDSIQYASDILIILHILYIGSAIYKMYDAYYQYIGCAVCSQHYQYSAVYIRCAYMHIYIVLCTSYICADI